MTKLVHYCDYCGKESDPDGRFSLIVDRKMDGAGDMDDIVEDVDLCPKCRAAALRSITQQLDYKGSAAFVRLWRVKRG